MYCNGYVLFVLQILPIESNLAMFFKSKYQKKKKNKKKTGTYFAIISLLSEENANESNMNS